MTAISLLACEDGLHAFDPSSGRQTWLVDPAPGVEGHRKNDGRIDSAGNLRVSTLRERDYAPVGAIYRVTYGLDVACVFDGLAIPNSLALDATRRRLYLADTRACTIWVCDHEPESGWVGERQVFATTTAPARPDGSCVDVEGHLWNVEYAGGRLVRYAPCGEITRVIELPVSHPTCCCFGGPNLDRLDVTSAREPQTAAQCRAEPLAGRVLAMDVGVLGCPEYRAAL